MGVHHLNVLDFQRQTRTRPKPAVAMVAGIPIGGRAAAHDARPHHRGGKRCLGQTGPKVGSFDGGCASYMARIAWLGSSAKFRVPVLPVRDASGAIKGWLITVVRWRIWCYNRARRWRNALQNSSDGAGALPESGAECRL